MAIDNFKAILYADDMNLVCPRAHLALWNPCIWFLTNLPEIASTSINAELSNIQTWLIVNKLTANFKKPNKVNDLPLLTA